MHPLYGAIPYGQACKVLAQPPIHRLIRHLCTVLVQHGQSHATVQHLTGCQKHLLQLHIITLLAPSFSARATAEFAHQLALELSLL